MKKLILLLSLTLVIASFTTSNKTETSAVRYAFVTDTEHDKSLDEPGNNGYVNITTNIVEFSCDLSDNQVKYQYIDHYNAEEKNQNRERAFIGASGITTAWIYNTHDEAVASRREWLANKGNERKRRIENFSATCN